MRGKINISAYRGVFLTGKLYLPVAVKHIKSSQNRRLRLNIAAAS